MSQSTEPGYVQQLLFYALYLSIVFDAPFKKKAHTNYQMFVNVPTE